MICSAPGCGSRPSPTRMPRPPGVQILLALGGNPVDDAGDADRVVGAVPAGSFDRQAAGDAAVDIGEFIRLDIAGGLADAREHAEIRETCCSRSRLAPRRLP
jgi:hypothetical protein